jgi:opacity protein-like surface antigen
MFGIYGNSVDASHRVWSGGGGVVRYMNDGMPAVASGDSSDVAFLGEIRTGAAYQLTCNCRLTAAYRFIGVGGIALAVDQIPSDFSNAQHVGYVNNNGSLILHGLQLGAEFKF